MTVSQSSIAFSVTKERVDVTFSKSYSRDFGKADTTSLSGSRFSVNWNRMRDFYLNERQLAYEFVPAYSAELNEC